MIAPQSKTKYFHPTTFTAFKTEWKGISLNRSTRPEREVKGTSEVAAQESKVCVPRSCHCLCSLCSWKNYSSLNIFGDTCAGNSAKHSMKHSGYGHFLHRAYYHPKAGSHYYSGCLGGASPGIHDQDEQRCCLLPPLALGIPPHLFWRDQDNLLDSPSGLI